MSSKLRPLPKPNYSLATIEKQLPNININKLYPALREKGYLQLDANEKNEVAPQYEYEFFFLNKAATYRHKETGFDFIKPQIFATAKGLELLKRDYRNGDFIMKKNKQIQSRMVKLNEDILAI